MYLQQVVACSWVVATLYHAMLLWNATPVYMFRHAIPIAAVISLMYGRLRCDDRRVVWLHVPSSLVLVMVIQTGAAYLDEYGNGFYGQSIGELALDLHKRLGFWVLLSLNATDATQVLLPLYMMVRIHHRILGSALL